MEQQFPFNIEAELGEIQFFQEECPGVYYLSCRSEEEGSPCAEWYIVEEATPAISTSVKKMGKRLSNHPDLLAYYLDDLSGGQKIVEYEANRFCAMNNLPLANNVTLYDLAMDGMETNPEYFGTFPIPFHTPWGHTLRHKAIDNGVYWIETEQCCRILAVCCIFHDELSDAALKLAVLERREREEKTDYFFFSQEASCIPIFELMQVRHQWETSCINKKALENAIWRYYPEYAVMHNAQEASGQHDLTSLVFNSMGGDMALTGYAKQMIVLSPDIGTNFCMLME